MQRKGDNVYSSPQPCSISKLQVIGKKDVSLYPLHRCCSHLDLQALNVFHVGFF